MLKRKKKVQKKPLKKAPKKAAKKVVKKTKALKKPTNPAAFNQAAHWRAYKQLQMRADQAWAKFRSDVAKKANSEIILQDHRHLLLILGECDYMAREYIRMADQAKKGRK
jgi:hypothetical protein